MKRALICGITGQDGAYLAKLLLEKNYVVCGTSRDAQMSSMRNLVHLGIRDRVRMESMALNDFRSVVQVITHFAPDEIYNLAGQTSVGLSFEQPMESFESITVGTLNLLEALRFIGSGTRLYNAGSSESFGDTGGTPANEESPFRPRSPYALAKAAAFWAVANYREACLTTSRPCAPSVSSRKKLSPPQAASRAAAAKNSSSGTSKSCATGAGRPNTSTPCIAWSSSTNRTIF